MRFRSETADPRRSRSGRHPSHLLRLVLLAAVCSTVAGAQYLPFRFRHLGTDQGLSNQIVTCVLRDRTGYLWVGTENGLNRYDGYRFTTFPARPDDPAALKDGAISTLYEDRAGHLWIGTKAGGLHVFDPRSETFSAIQEGPDAGARLSSNRIYRVYEDAASNLWIGTAGGLDRLTWDGASVASARVVSFRSDAGDPRSLSHNRVTSIAQDGQGTIWVGTRAGLNRLVSEDPPQFDRFVSDPAAPASLHDDEVYALLVDSRDVLWVGAWGGGGLARLSAAERARPVPSFERIPIGPDPPSESSVDIVVDLLEDRAGDIWICTGDNGRLLRLAAADRDVPKPAFQVFANDDGNPYSLSGGSTVNAFSDSQGILWAANLDGGLERLNTRESVFELYRSNPRVPGLPSSVITAVVRDRDGTLWIGSDSGLTRVDPPPGPYAQPRFTTYTDETPGGLRSSGISSLLVDTQGRLWVATINGGLTVRTSTGDRTAFRTFVRDPADPRSIGHDAVLALLEDSRGAIWAGTYRGLYRMDALPAAGSPTFVAYLHGEDPATLTSDQIEALAEGPDGAIWVGTASGLNRLDPATGTVVRFTPDRSNPASLSDAFIHDLQMGPDGGLWIATRGGLCRLDPSSNAITRVPATSGLDRASVASLAFDRAGALWAGTINGLFRLEPSTGASTVFGKGDGLPSEVFNRGAAYCGTDGRVHVGSAGGLVVFDPARLEADVTPPNVVLTRLLLANRDVPIRDGTVLPVHVQFLDRLDLAYTDNLFAIEFAALDMTRPDAVRYAYKLEGLYDQWIETDAGNRRATFTNLPDGDYTFRVRASKNAGPWGETGAALRIVVRPPWWRTWWARSGFYALAILALLAIPFLRVASLARQRARLEGVVEERTAELREANERLVEASRAKSLFLSNMSHELRTPLNAVIGFSQLMDRDPGLSGDQRQSLGLIQRAGEHLLGLINDVLSISKIEAGKLMLVEQVFDPHRMLKSVEEIIRVRAEAKDLQLVFDVAPGLPAAVRGDEGKLRQVLINLLGNAVKFTDRGGVSLRCAWKDDGRAGFEIEDTGVGISEDEIGSLFEAFVQTESGRTAKEGTGLGLVISRQIVRMMGGDITVRSQAGVGTVFAFDVNLSPADAAEARTEQRRVLGLELDQPVPRILVVDDSHENRLLLTRLLGSIGAMVTEAANGRDAVERWESWTPDLIFMDLRMPGMDGYEATAEIRRREHEAGGGAHCPIVALTASAFEHERGTIIEKGADDFVTKPYREETIFEKLGQHLGVRFRYREADAAPAPEAGLGDDAAVAGRLRELPGDVVRELYEALANGDRKAAATIADRIRESDEPLATAVHERIRAYRLDELMTVIEGL